ncbi:MAG: hypothetical protein H6Q74_1202 [Firmicutes bacterium]|nr:hypothetical protein [Bacillota bacterium]
MSTDSSVVAGYYQDGGTVVTANEAYTGSETNEYGVYVTDGGTLTLANCSVTTSGATTSTDDSSFYGLNAGVLACDASTITLSDCTVTTSGLGANGVFATDSGSSVTLSNVTIDCTGGLGHGVDATYGGVLTLTDVDITTSGNSGAALATDRGGGTITATGGTMTTAGSGSPGIYSTGTITVDGATISATGSEGAVIEGLNSIILTDTVLSGAKKCGAMIYQSFSGDAEVGTGTFTMTGGSLTAEVGPLFYSTNTTAVVKLTDVDATAASGVILKASADNWGTEGENGADVTFTADSQTLTGDVVADAVSTISLTLQNSSTLTGTINGENTASSIALTLDATSIWSVTGTSYLTTLSDSDTTLANIDDNGYTIYYDSSLSANSWLNAETYTLTDGGKLAPTFAAYYQDGGTVEKTDEVFVATEPDEYGIYVTGGGTLTLAECSVTTSGATSDSTSSSSTGLNAGVIALDSSTITISDTTITTTGNGANGAYAIGADSVISLSDVTISTAGDFAHGVDAVDGGSITVEDATISTAGAHCSAISTDGESGAVTVIGGTATAAGSLSAGLYSTGTITVSGATITSKAAEGAVIAAGAVEHTITVTDSALTGSTAGVQIFNTSQKAMGSNSVFTMSGGSLTATAGPVFYGTNTKGTFAVSDVTITTSTDGILIEVGANDWGTSGDNGGDMILTADSQTLVGDFVADSISTITATLSNSSTLTGTINGDSTASSIALTLDATSSWNVTGDSYLTIFSDSDATFANITGTGNIYYDSTLSANSWLNGEIYATAGTGKVMPK